MIRQGTLEIVIKEVLWSIRGSYQAIWSSPLKNVKWYYVTWPYTMKTPYWSDLIPNSTLNLIGFHRTFATGVGCRHGTLTPPDTWSRPCGTCICSTCRDNSFFRICCYFSGLCSSNIPRYFLDSAFLSMAAFQLYWIAYFEYRSCWDQSLLNLSFCAFLSYKYSLVLAWCWMVLVEIDGVFLLLQYRWSK